MSENKSENKYKKEITPENRALIEDYLNRLPKHEMEEKYGYQFDTLRVRVNRMGYKRGLPKTFTTNRNFPELEICQQYKSGKSTGKLAKSYKCSPSTIWKILVKNKVKCRLPHKRGSIYTTHSDFFTKIDTPQKAYFLGLMYSDGNVSGSNNTISLSLKESDRGILNNLLPLIQPDGKLKYIPRNSNRTRKNLKKSFGDYNFKSHYEGRYCISITNKQIHSDLIKHGCFPNKSLSLSFPSAGTVPDKLIHHFMRGYFDGDGCVCKSGYGSFSITGTADFVTKYRQKLIHALSLKTNKIYQRDKTKNTCTVRYNGYKNLQAIYDFLYNDADLFLTRKYKSFNEILKKL